jgi:transposase
MTPGRPVVLYRRVLDGILFVLRTGCQWKAVPAAFGSGSTCHRRFQQRVEDGIWARLWGDQLRRDDDAHRIGWYRRRKVCYCWRTSVVGANQSGAVASLPNGVLRIEARGRSANQSLSRQMLSAAAVRTCWRRVLARPR